MTDSTAMKHSWLLALPLFLAVPRGLPGAEVAEPVRGQRIFSACAACHTPGDPTKTGPDLRGVVGRRAGTLAGFRFSRALRTARLTWNDSTLDSYLAEPQAAIPGNTMPYPGLPDAGERLDLIAYLKTLK